MDLKFQIGKFQKFAVVRFNVTLFVFFFSTEVSMASALTDGFDLP